MLISASLLIGFLVHTLLSLFPPLPCVTQEIAAVLIASESFRSFRKANRGIIVGAAVGSLAARSKAMPYPRPALPSVDRYAARFRGETHRRACRIRICSLASGLAANIRPGSDRRTSPGRRRKPGT